jgi:hypothetical protein
MREGPVQYSLEVQGSLWNGSRVKCHEKIKGTHRRKLGLIGESYVTCLQGRRRMREGTIHYSFEAQIDKRPCDFLPEQSPLPWYVVYCTHRMVETKTLNLRHKP